MIATMIYDTAVGQVPHPNPERKEYAIQYYGSLSEIPPEMRKHMVKMFLEQSKERGLQLDTTTVWLDVRQAYFGVFHTPSYVITIRALEMDTSDEYVVTE